LFVLKAVRSTVSRLEKLILVAVIRGSVMGGIHASGSVG